MNTSYTQRIASTVLVIMAFASLSAGAAQRSLPESWSARVVWVVNGHSLIVENPDGNATERIELAGIEIVKRQAAADQLHDLVYDKEVEIVLVGEKVDPTVRVLYEGSDLADVLVEAGVARRSGPSLQPMRRLGGLARLGRAFFGGDRPAV